MFFFYGYDMILFLFVIITLTFLFLFCKLLCVCCCRRNRSRGAYQDLSYDASQVIPAPPLRPSYAVVGNTITAPYQNYPEYQNYQMPIPADGYKVLPPPPAYSFPSTHSGYQASEYYNAGADIGTEVPDGSISQQNATVYGFAVDGRPSYLEPPPPYSSIREFQQQRLQPANEDPNTNPNPNAPRLQE